MTWTTYVGMFGIFIFSVQICLSQAFNEADFLNLRTRMETMEMKIAVLEMKDTKQQKIILNQQETIDHQGNIIADIQHDLEKHSEAIAELKSVAAKHNIYIQHQTKKISTLERRYKTVMKSTPSTLWQIMQQSQIQGEHYKPDNKTVNNISNKQKSSTNNKSKQHIKTCKTATVEKKALEVKERFIVSGGQPIAFTARLSTSQSHVGIDQNIHFDSVVLNMGGGYNSDRSEFIAPQAGIYVFSSTILSTFNKEVHAAIVHNGNTVAIISAHGDIGYYEQGSQTVVIQVNQGENVWIKHIDNTDNTIYGFYYSTFSGYLLWPL